jgi:hypothetical protein
VTGEASLRTGGYRSGMASNVYIDGATVFVAEDRDAIRGMVDTAIGQQTPDGPPKWIELTRMDPNTWPPEPHGTAKVEARADHVGAVEDYIQ